MRPPIDCMLISETTQQLLNSDYLFKTYAYEFILKSKIIVRLYSAKHPTFLY